MFSFKELSIITDIVLGFYFKGSIECPYYRYRKKGGIRNEK